MNDRKVRGSWEKSRDRKGNYVHSPEGIARLRAETRNALIRYYIGIAENMWKYEFDGNFDDMVRMSRGLAPEKYLVNNGQAVFFRYAGQIHCLPMVYIQNLNIYGFEEQRRAVPVNFNKDGNNPDVYNEIYNTVLDDSNSVVIRNDMFGSPDVSYIETMVDQLCDNCTTLNTLQMLAKAPYLYRVNQDNILTAKNMYLAIAEDNGVVYVDDDTMPLQEIAVNHNVKIDTGLMDLFSHWDMLIKQYLGIPCTDIHKRAQQTVDETNMQDDAISVRRQERFKQRQQAMERLSEVFGCKCSVRSVIDDNEDNEEREGEEKDGELAAESD